MKANELRIGNWIQSRGLTGEFHNWQVTSEDIPQIETNDDLVDQYRAILLTEEWLLKFWFVRIRNYPVFSKQDIRIELNLERSEWSVDLSDRRIVVPYVHQLQNLYFALTGEELIAK